jgi:hypothetical protein
LRDVFRLQEAEGDHLSNMFEARDFSKHFTGNFFHQTHKITSNDGTPTH